MSESLGSHRHVAEARSPRLFTLPPSVPFLSRIVDALLDGELIPGFAPREDPLALASATIYVPTRRAARGLPALFQKKLGTRAALLPAIRPLGDVDEDALLLAPAPAVDGLPPALPDMERRMAMTRLVYAWEGALRREILELPPGAVLKAPASAADAAWLATALVALMDEVETEEVDWGGLLGLVPEDHARYWQITLDFLKIAMEHWPAYLAGRGAMDPKARRSALIRREARRLAASPPDGPIIVAGTTGSIPATAELLSVVAGLPQGAIVLPGFDPMMSRRARDVILGRGEEADATGAPSHPQHGMLRLIDALGASPDDIRDLGPGAFEQADREALSLRDGLVGHALCPAEITDEWPQVMAAIPVDERRRAFAGVSLVGARNEADEALTIALALREAIGQGRTAALVTPDRTLARRVIGELARWQIVADDSAGRPLDQTAPGVLARLAAGLALEGLDPVALLALLKHPLSRLGLPAKEIRSAARALERAVLRGPRPRGGSEGLRQAVVAARDLALSDDSGHMPRWKDIHDDDWEAVVDLVERLCAALEPLESLADQRGPVDVSRLVTAHERVLAAIARDETGDVSELYAGEAGEGLAGAFAEMLAAHPAGLAVPPRDWPAVFQALVSGINVRRSLPGDPRIAILGPMEARLQAFDRVVLGGLNEGTWPQSTRNDPWLSRPMKHGIGLDPPERRIGGAAHDFTQGLGAGEVILSRAERADGAPTVPSRWLLRLTTLLGAEVSGEMRMRGERLRTLAAHLDVSASPVPAPRPEPVPPVEARPPRISVTEVETLIRDPYAVYARRVLALDPVDPIGGDPGAAEKGTLIHDCLAAFLAEDPPLDQTALPRLLAIGREKFAPLDAFPEVRAIWWLRFQRIAEAFVAYETARARHVRHRYLEIAGRMEIDLAPGRIVTLSGRADRIDLMEDGTLSILDYKTGQMPSGKQVASLLAPQLPLEAAMVGAGAFAGIDPGAAVEELLYLRLSGGREPLEKGTRGPAKDQTMAEFTAEALARTRALLATYENPSRGYLSRARVMSEGEMNGPYDHLARVAEWALGGGDDA
ncbi:MAG: double-strand break repair protein AddB [Stappia sp.]|uniref:double-strand break repair protein AddB n=1 Tax=Stappia sp. TaxID=1870903 RepID=UPI000C5B4555|nr:double-strand break repair protein AddB [Stappia sp.]MAA99257.1 double-strand break repair protein AddB [Stappia sp.]MBM19333.1 double-strand break repair protein AddB [Stappia sp.]